MEVFSYIIALIVAVFNIILLVKIWNMTSDVRKIRELLETRKLQESAHASQEAITAARDFVKGGMYRLKFYGVCKYGGQVDGLYYFYPEATDNLRPSPFLVKREEPCLAIPAQALASFEISKA